MADGAAVKHDYHLVKPSPWPLLGSIAMLAMFFGMAGYMKGFLFVPKGAWWGPLPGLVALIFVLIGWWFSGVWMAVAYVLLLTIIGIPGAFWMYNRIGAVTTLHRR